MIFFIKIGGRALDYAVEVEKRVIKGDSLFKVSSS